MKDLTSGNIYKTFIFFAIPMVLSGILSQAYGLIDSVIAGKFLGSSGLAATSATAALITVIESMFWGFESGFSIYIAKLFGAKEYKKIKSAVYNISILITVMTVLIGIILIMSYGHISRWLKIDEAIRHDNFVYFAIVSAGLCTLLFNVNGVFLMNAFGISQFPFYMSLISGFLNVLGNIFTVTVFGMGVAGVALSTVLSALVVTIFYIFEFRRCFLRMGVEKEKVKLGFSEVKESMSYALPVMSQQMIMYIAGLIIAPVINGIGASATAAYAVVTRVYNLSASVYQNSAKSLSNFTAQCMGAKKYRKIKKGVKVGMIQGILFMLPFLILSVIFAEEFCGAFFPKGYDGEDLTSSILFTRVYLPFVVFALIDNLFHAFFRGVKAMKYLIISTAFGAVIRTVATICFVELYGMEGVYIGWVASWILEAVYVLGVYFSGKWKSKEMKN